MAKKNIKEALITFFDKFTIDFKSFDGAIIASRYLPPYTAIHSNKSVSLFSEHKDITQYFSSILTAYKAQCVAYCTYSNFEHTKLEDGAVLATMDWNMMKDDGTLVAKWRESYILIFSNKVLKIVTSIDH